MISYMSTLKERKIYYVIIIFEHVLLHNRGFVLLQHNKVKKRDVKRLSQNL